LNNAWDWKSFDKQHLWHPYSSLLNPTPAYPVVGAEGAEIILENGTRLVDGMASWWAAIHGYNHPVLNAALHKQIDTFPHVMFGGLTHQPAAELGKRLLEITPDSLDHVFFADSGSIAVEVALKMAIQCWIGRGHPEKHKILTVRGGYYGDTLAPMAICDPVNGMHHLFSAILPKQYFVDAPLLGDNPHSDDDIEKFAEAIAIHHRSTAAVIIEPLVQGAGGMRIYRSNYLRNVAKLCQDYNVLLILDEIATGFGRTGTLFATEQADVKPDIFCLGKALTGGTMSLAATLVSDTIATDIGHSETGAFMHGPTFMANPLACAVSSASIDLLLEQDWQNTVLNIEQQLQLQLAPCRNLNCVKDVRVKGAIGVVELYNPIALNAIQNDFVEAGVWIRPFRNLVYIMPPYIITPKQLEQLTATIFSVIKNRDSTSRQSDFNLQTF
jgi:adenosylmethionine-8-amino-7-oxononanoate aminotransferase